LSFLCPNFKKSVVKAKGVAA